jgi:predicted  nucleic acid-binding Zn-ribbon protein
MWFRNYYRCERCGHEWTDEWSATCDDDCPKCGARHMSPLDSDDLSVIVRPVGAGFVVFRSADTAEHDPDYRKIASFPTRREAEDYADGGAAELN